jgi:myo-inositol-1(or 4)-monophosphatase
MSNAPDELLRVAVEVVRAAADLARDLREQGVSGVATKSTTTDVVTAADKAIERYVRDVLRERRPGETVLGEESGESTGTGRVRWILDPIDGTVNYLYGLPQYAVSLAAELDGRVVAGVVRNAANGEEWTAVRGEGGYRAGHRLGGSAVTELGQALVAT